MDPLKILGLDSSANREDIDRAYREKARKHHPDLGGDAWAFQQVQEAYQQLTNQKAEPNVEPNQTHGNQSSHPEAKHQNPGSGSELKAKRPQNEALSAQSDASNSTPNTTKSKGILTGELPLQSETCWFIFVNCLDIFMTVFLLLNGAKGGRKVVESNPIANFFLQRWDSGGLVGFKLFIVALVCVIAQIIARKKIATARFLLIVGTIIVGCVVVYSYMLYQSN